jgi:hypothetical protein
MITVSPQRHQELIQIMSDIENGKTTLQAQPDRTLEAFSRGFTADENGVKTPVTPWLNYLAERTLSKRYRTSPNSGIHPKVARGGFAV